MTTTPDTKSPTAHAGERVRVSAVAGMYGKQLHAESWPFGYGDVVLIFCPDGTVRWEASA